MRTVLSRLLLPALLLAALLPAVQSVAGPVPETAAAPPTGPARIYVANAPLGDVVGRDQNGTEVRRVPTRFGDGGGDAFALGDVDGNGTDDPLIADAQSGNVLVHLREGLVGVVEGVGYDADAGAADGFAAGDVDGDGVDEIIVAHAPAGNIVAYSRTGAVVSEATGTGFDSDSGNGADGFAVGDVDGSGTDDLVVANAPAGNVVAFNRNGGALSQAVGTGFDSDPGSGRDGFAVGDVTGDGVAELLIANAPGGDVVALHRAGGTPVDTTAADFDSDPGAEDRIAVGDVDADGFGDLVVAQAPSEDLDIHFGPGGFFRITDSGFDSQAGSPDGFAVGTDAGRDLDGDAVPDRVERRGVRAADGTLLLSPSNPCRETINVEIDYETGPGGGFVPAAKGIADVQAAFARAPRPGSVYCPYPGVPQLAGIELRVGVDEPLATGGPVGPAASFDAIKAAHFEPLLDRYVHYNVWASKVVDPGNGAGIGGYCCYGSRGKDFLAESEGDDLEQGTTFMHELGHALGLGHGGGDGINYKPNYHSVMSYWYSHLGLRRTDVLGPDGKPAPEYDFSRTGLPPLDETALSEPTGIFSQVPYESHFFVPSGASLTVPANGPVDWNDDGDTTDQGVQLNVNADANGYCVGTGPDGTLASTEADDDVREFDVLILAGPDFVCDTAAAGDDQQLAPVGTAPKLVGHDDWAAIRFGGSGSPAGILRNVPELTNAQAEQLAASFDQAHSPDRSVQLAPPRPGFHGTVRGLAVDGDRLFATHHYTAVAEPFGSDRPGQLVVLDRATLQVTGRVPVGFLPRAIAVNPTTKRVYVLSGTDPADPTRSRITVVDRTSLAVLARVDFSTAQATADIAVNPRTNRVYVANTAADKLHVFNGATNQELAPILVGPGPVGLAVDPGRNTVFAALSKRGGPEPELAALGSVVDDGVTRTVNPPVTLGPPLTQPIDVAVDPGQARVYVANLGGGGVHPSLSVLDSRTRSIVKTVPVAGPARAVAVNPEAHRVFIASEGAASTIDTDRLEVVRVARPGLAFSVATGSGPSREIYYGDLRSGALTRLSYSSGEPA